MLFEQQLDKYKECLQERERETCWGATPDTATSAREARICPLLRLFPTDGARGLSGRLSVSARDKHSPTHTSRLAAAWLPRHTHTHTRAKRCARNPSRPLLFVVALSLSLFGLCVRESIFMYFLSVLSAHTQWAYARVPCGGVCTDVCAISQNPEPQPVYCPNAKFNNPSILCHEKKKEEISLHSLLK